MIEILLPASRAGGRSEVVSFGVSAEELADCRQAAARDGMEVEPWLAGQLRRKIEAR